MSGVLPLVVLSTTSCDRIKKFGTLITPQTEGLNKGYDEVYQENNDYRLRIRGLYNNRRFAQLEAEAKTARESKARMRNGAWKLNHFYTCLACREDEPESMWQLHDRIHQDWIAAFPKSITARIAYADFQAEYAWHARGAGFSPSVSKEGWKLFGERLAQSRKTLEDAARELTITCPMWFQIRLRVALGQNASREQYESIYQAAKKSEPQFTPFDFSHAKYLLPRWNGKPGEWEAAAEKDAEWPGGLGLEGYASVVSQMRGYYGNIFKETKVSWPKTKQGFEQMLAKYPDSLEVLSVYTSLACEAGDQATAKRLFEKLGNRVYPSAWDETGFARGRAWAMKSVEQ